MPSDVGFIDGCSLCNRLDSPHLCESCGLVSYCSLSHLQQHKSVHDRSCWRIVTKRRVAEQNELRDEHGNVIRPEDIDKSVEGWRFQWGNLEYILSHMDLINEIEKLKTRQGLEAVLTLMCKTGHLYRNDEENTMDIICLLFRLGRYEEFYNLAKSHIKQAPTTPYSLYGRDRTFQDWLKTINGRSDPFEGVQWLTSSDYHVDIILLVMLLKINMLCDLFAAEAATYIVGCRVPQEILDHILSFLSTTSVITISPNFLSRFDHKGKIETLRHQIQELYTAISKRKSNLWEKVIKGEESQWGGSCPGHVDFPTGCLSNFKCGPYHAIDFWHADPLALQYLTKLDSSGSACDDQAHQVL